MLDTKRAIIKDVLQQIEQQLANIDDQEYLQLLKKLLSQVNLEQGVVYPAQNKEQITKQAYGNS